MVLLLSSNFDLIIRLMQIIIMQFHSAVSVGVNELFKCFLPYLELKHFYVDFHGFPRLVLKSVPSI